MAMATCSVNVLVMRSGWDTDDSAVLTQDPLEKVTWLLLDSRPTMGLAVAAYNLYLLQRCMRTVSTCSTPLNEALLVVACCYTIKWVK